MQTGSFPDGPDWGVMVIVGIAAVTLVVIAASSATRLGRSAQTGWRRPKGSLIGDRPIY
ncbi:hypothetical protein PY650_23260 [Rhizobium calliandrae]|uniref:Uncharacterized protein n=1 Tax=Rhizobium calliandrae TaxID=1312182 RepID=A0ABT7KIP3_9HYPH|nr:hypothetical protein [Rhizobium calliandrae]MDL2408509.1 hypothetical protein [Rhizobium calliandrae]